MTVGSRTQRPPVQGTVSVTTKVNRMGADAFDTHSYTVPGADTTTAGVEAPEVPAHPNRTFPVPDAGGRFSGVRFGPHGVEIIPALTGGNEWVNRFTVAATVVAITIAATRAASVFRIPLTRNNLGSPIV